jgi:hypothetical protein
MLSGDAYKPNSVVDSYLSGTHIAMSLERHKPILRLEYGLAFG